MSRLDRFWMHQDIKIYTTGKKIELARTGDRSGTLHEKELWI